VITFLEKVQAPTSETDKVTIIIPTYNRLGTLTKTVESIIKQKYEAYEIIVVDDGSTDGTVEEMKKYGGLRVLSTQGRKGPSHARNLAISKSKGSYLWFLDSDVILPDEGMLERMITAFHNSERTGSLGGEIVPAEGKTGQAYGRKILWDGHNKRVKAYENAKMVECDYLATCNCLTKKEFAYKLKGFDERFVFGAEDMDFGARLKQLGLKNYVWHDSSVLHYHSKTGRYEDETVRYQYTRVQFAKKHFNGVRLVMIFLFDLIKFIGFYGQLPIKVVLMKFKSLPLKKQNFLGGWYLVKPYFTI